MTAPACRPWWKKKRWAAAAALLIVAYPASSGPVAYAVGRGWLPSGAGGHFYGPLRSAVNGTRLAGAWEEYRVACFHAGLRHHASD